MKRVVSLLLVLLLLTGAFSGCAGKKETGRFSVVVTVFPAYDWLMNVLGDAAEDYDVTLLQDNGLELHSYQPSTADTVKIVDCDLFIYVGGPSDGWVASVLAQSANPAMQTVCLMDELGALALAEEVKEGMQAEAEEEPEPDEHVWLSLDFAARFTQAICDALCRLDDANAELFAENCGQYVQALRTLDETYRTTLAGCKGDTLLFADRFPFRYLTEDYGLQYYAAFPGCSAESDPGVATLTFLADKLKSLALPAVLVLETGDTKLAQTVIETAGVTDVQILRLNAMQAITSAQRAQGTTYLSVMEQNLETLKTALEG